MKLIKDYAGSYYGEDVVDGYDIRVEVETLSGRGFSYSIYVNNSLIFEDGWYGLTLRDIKAGLDNDIDYAIEEYES